MSLMVECDADLDLVTSTESEDPFPGPSAEQLSHAWVLSQDAILTMSS